MKKYMICIGMFSFFASSLATWCTSAPTDDGGSQLIQNKTNRVSGVSKVYQAHIGGLSRNLKIESIPGQGTSGRSTLVQMPTGELGPSGYDFAVNQGEDVVWVFLHRVMKPANRPICVVHAFVKGHGTNDLDRALSLAGSCVDVSGILSRLSESYFRQGQPLKLGRDAHIRDVQLEYVDENSVRVIGKIGKGYAFSGIIMLGDQKQLFTKDFAIIPQ